MLKILLIDDDLFERRILTYHLQQINYIDFEIKQVSTCSDGVNSLLSNRYDIVLLDNALKDSISAEFSVPFIKEHLNGCPLVIISNNIQTSFLRDPDILGIDYIIDKVDLSKFMIRMLPVLQPKKVKLSGYQ